MVSGEYQKGLPPAAEMEIEFCVYEGKGLVKRFKDGMADAMEAAAATAAPGGGGKTNTKK